MRKRTRRPLHVSAAIARELGGAPSTCAAGACCRSRRTRSSANGTSRERELVLGVAYALLQFTPSVVDAGEAVVLLDVTASLRLFHGIRALRQRVRDVAVSFGVTAVVSVAWSGPAAWMIARGLRGGVALSARSLHRALAVAPPARPYVQWYCQVDG
ncbi:hypothetical protein WK64_06895 [Burkholderia ubonensis]|nr:hypothetical protein WK64_06895 [Burkholderia ubonensis]